jgi:hypothetical protein
MMRISFAPEQLDEEFKKVIDCTFYVLVLLFENFTAQISLETKKTEISI